MADQPTPAPPSAADRLARSLADLATGVQGLRQDVHAAERARRRVNRVVSAAVALLVLGLLAVLVLGWQNTRITRQNNDLGRQIADCTTIGGDCYERGNARTGAAVEELVRANLYLHECVNTRGVDTDGELEDCLQRKMTAARPGR